MSEGTFFLWLLLIHLFRHILGPEFFLYLFYQKIVEQIKKLKIQNDFAAKEQIIKERTWIKKSQFVDFSIIIISIFMYQNGYFKLEIATLSRSGLSSALNLLYLILLQDFYFYLTHRVLHFKWLYRHIHIVHHQSVLTTPLTSFSVHPIEKFIELFFFPIVLIFLPVTGAELLVFIFLSSLVNILGHCGFEFKWMFLKKADPIGATTVFHEMHHMYPNSNYSLYLTIWDKLLKTEHKKYQKLFASRMKTR